MFFLNALQSTTTSLWIQIALVLIIATILGFVIRKILANLSSLRSTPIWIKSLCESFHTPSAWLIWGYRVLIALEIFAHQETIAVPTSLIAKTRNIFFVSVATWVLLGWKKKFEEILVEKINKKETRSFDITLVEGVGKVFSIFLFSISGLVILDILGIQLTALLAFGGLGGVAIGLAAKDLVANLFGGLMIHINRPFAIGDWIYSPNKNFEGTVEDIGWYLTRIRTFERRPMFVPNALITDAIIENPGRMYNRRIKQKIGVRYQDIQKIKVIVNDIEKMLQNHPAIDTSQTLLVHFLEFGPSSLDIEVYCFTKTTSWKEWREQQQDVFIKIAEIIDSHEGEIAFPTQTLHLESERQRQAALSRADLDLGVVRN